MLALWSHLDLSSCTPSVCVCTDSGIVSAVGLLPVSPGDFQGLGVLTSISLEDPLGCAWSLRIGVGRWPFAQMLGIGESTGACVRLEPLWVALHKYLLVSH